MGQEALGARYLRIHGKRRVHRSFMMEAALSTARHEDEVVGTEHLSVFSAARGGRVWVCDDIYVVYTYRRR